MPILQVCWPLNWWDYRCEPLQSARFYLFVSNDGRLSSWHIILSNLNYLLKIWHLKYVSILLHSQTANDQVPTPFLVKLLWNQPKHMRIKGIASSGSMIILGRKAGGRQLEFILKGQRKVHLTRLRFHLTFWEAWIPWVECLAMLNFPVIFKKHRNRILWWMGGNMQEQWTHHNFITNSGV